MFFFYVTNNGYNSLGIMMRYDLENTTSAARETLISKDIDKLRSFRRGLIR